MCSNVYCPFCGVVLLPDPYSIDPDSPPTRAARPWYAEVRGIYSTDIALGHVAITGLGIVRCRNKLNAPFNSDLSYVDVGVEALEEWGICKPAEGRWCFGFHGSCWRLLLLRIAQETSYGPKDDMAVASSIFHQLFCTPCLNTSIFQFGHDYGAASQTHKSFGRPKPVDLESHFYADPYAIPSMEELEAIVPAPSETRYSSLSKWRESPDTRGEKYEELVRPNCLVFDKLSVELLFTIFSYLSFSELLDMRLVCRDLALCISVNALPQSYWRSRFLLGQEADFLFLNVAVTRNWAKLFAGTQVSLRNGNLPLANRRRIRQLLEPIAALLFLEHVPRKDIYGAAYHPVESHDGSFQLVESESAECFPHFMKRRSFLSGHLATVSANAPLEDGCRVLYHRAQLLEPLRPQEGQRIGISTVQIGARIFISGIRLAASGQSTITNYPVGYHNPATEKWIEIPPGFYVEALKVAFCSQGLRGIEAIFTNSKASGWIGDSNHSDIAYGIIRISEKLAQHCLLAGLDQYKIVSIGLGEFIDHPETSLKAHPQDLFELSHLQSCLWTTHAPEHETLRFSSLLPSQPDRSFEPLINIDIGGPRGQLLGSLTRLVFYMASGPRPLNGIELYYSDRKSVHHGSKEGCEVSFLIAGSMGERINGISILEDNLRSYPETGLGGLQVSTNYGRTETFAPLHYRLNATFMPIPTSPSEDTITGFVAFKMTRQIPLVRIGVQSQQCDEQLTMFNVPDIESHRIPDHQLQYDRRFSHFIDASRRDNYQTYASLKNVQRIQASMGIEGRSRSPTRISGLKIEYYDRPTPCIVGQWMAELDDEIELSFGEEIQSLTTWLVPSDFSRECPTMEISQVVAVRIETTCCRSVTFQPPDLGTLPPRQHQYQIDSDEKMTAVSWIMNTSADCVRAVISANERQRNLIAVPELEAPFDQIRKLYFETQGGDGRRETIVTAEAYFRDRTIVGLVFVYGSGAKASTGEVDTGSCRRVHIPQDAQIVGLSNTVIESELTEIQLVIQQDGLSRHETLGLCIASESTIVSGWRDIWCSDGMSVEDYQRLGRAYKRPHQSKLIGIYVGCVQSTCFGALYEADAHQ